MHSPEKLKCPGIPAAVDFGGPEWKHHGLPDHPTKQLASLLIPPVPEFPITLDTKAQSSSSKYLREASNIKHRDQNNQEKGTQKKQIIPRDKENVKINDNILRKDEMVLNS